MRHARIWQGGGRVFWVGLTLLSAFGCTHNYYYGTVPNCGPTVVPSATANGAVCEVPTQVTGGGNVIARGPTRSTIISGGPILAGPRPPRVVVSEPSPGLLRGWRKTDPEASLATTKVDGALDDSTVNR